jgi:hypothetical protein
VSAVSTAPAGAQPPRLAPADAPTHARQLAARLSALFDRDVELVKRLNDAHDRLADANEQLYSGLAPDTVGHIYNDTTAAIRPISQTAALIRDGAPAANSPTLDTPQQAHWTIHRAFRAYQDTSEQRRQLAFEVGELAQQLTQTLCAAGWTAQEARQANVHQLAQPTGPPASPHRSQPPREHTHQP